ncbi:MAG: hypothetical protein HQL23_07670 [Candidatus Omnitrophica bacterium]|nr:hypothetical protein [Candidatus Omnitrophota bacterium]
MIKRRFPGMEKTLIDEEKKDIEARHSRSHSDRLVRAKPKNERRRVVKTTEYKWITNLRHWDQRRIFNVLKCKETQDGRQNCDYTWLVSGGLNLGESTVRPLARAGRCRWKIENEGNNTQKNEGYRLEHLYSRDEVSMKIWHALINIAHTINQLIERGSLIAVRSFGSLRDFSQRLFEHFRYLVFEKPPHPPRIQIRLCWDSS